MRFRFEALNQFSLVEKKVAKPVIESLILKHDGSRFSGA